MKSLYLSFVFLVLLYSSALAQNTPEMFQEKPITVEQADTSIFDEAPVQPEQSVLGSLFSTLGSLFADKPAVTRKKLPLDDVVQGWLAIAGSTDSKGAGRSDAWVVLTCELTCQ